MRIVSIPMDFTGKIVAEKSYIEKQTSGALSLRVFDPRIA